MFQAWQSAPLAGAVLAACLSAFVHGGPMERRGAAVYVMALAAVTLMRSLATASLAAELAIDGALFAGLFVLSWKARAGWPIWTAALQSVAVGVDLAGLLRPEVAPHARTAALWALGAAQASAWAWGAMPASRVMAKITLR